MNQAHDSKTLEDFDSSDSKGVRGKYAQRYAQSTITFRSLTERADNLSSLSFEDRARLVLGDYYGVDLAPDSVPSVHKRFDLVSPDKQFVGDAKFYSLVGGTKRPPAKLATINEHVWLLEKTGAPNTFLVFGNDRRVPELWLKDYGPLLSDVKFYFLDDDNRLELLTGPRAATQSEQLIGAEGR